jgi:pimeloyl-ACP methyl ester carboxylesterase
VNIAEVDAWWQGGRRVGMRLGGYDRQVFVRDDGAGPVLLLLHGFPASSLEWSAVWPALTARHRVIAPDFLGFGASDKPRGHRYRITEQADLIEQLLHAVDVTAPAVYAYDYGAIVAQELLARSVPMRHTIFANSGLFPELYRPRLVQRLAITPLVGSALSAVAANRRTFRRTWGAVFSPQHPLAADTADAHYHALRAGGAPRRLQRDLLAYIPERAAMADRLQAASLANAQRTSYLWGMHDPVSGAPIARRLRELTPDADVVEYRDVGHCPHLEIPTRVAADLLERLAA